MHISTSILKRALSWSSFIHPKRNTILIACMPKTASTFLQNVIADVSGYSTNTLCAGHGRNEQELYLPALVDNSLDNIVTHMHVRATDNNIALMQTARIRPIVLVRNIFDLVTSMRDHAVKQSPHWSMACFDTSFHTLDKPEQYDMVIDLCMPWFMYFYASWNKVTETQSLETYWLSYEELTNDKIGSIADLCQHYGIDASRQSIADAITKIEKNRVLSNFNKGVRGRGESELSDNQKQRLVNLTRYYPAIDFSPIGIE